MELSSFVKDKGQDLLDKNLDSLYDFSWKSYDMRHDRIRLHHDICIFLNSVTARSELYFNNFRQMIV